MSSRRSFAFAAVLAAATFASASACKDSNNVAGPVATSPATTLSGTWTGTYSSNASNCPAAPMTVTISQNGTQLTGNLTTNACGPHGGIKATVAGSTVTGNVEMVGCTGGGIMGHVQGGMMSLTIGDFYKPLVTQAQVVMEGGAATLSR